MRFGGWNAVPDGYGAWLEIGRAPWWLRPWFRTRIVDKFSYPVVVRRGFGHLTADVAPINHAVSWFILGMAGFFVLVGLIFHFSVPGKASTGTFAFGMAIVFAVAGGVLRFTGR